MHVMAIIKFHFEEKFRKKGNKDREVLTGGRHGWKGEELGLQDEWTNLPSAYIA